MHVRHPRLIRKQQIPPSCKPLLWSPGSKPGHDHQFSTQVYQAKSQLLQDSVQIRLPMYAKFLEDDTQLLTRYLPSQPTKVEPTLLFTQDLTSSYSVEQDADPSKLEEQKLFCRLLETGCENWQEILPIIKAKEPSALMAVVSIGGSPEQKYRNRILAHHLSTWLIDMGYQAEATQNQVIAIISSVFAGGNNNNNNNNNLMKVEKVATMLYESLLEWYLPPDLHLRALVQICRKGWNYFAFLICRLIKLMKRSQPTITHEELLQAIQA